VHLIAHPQESVDNPVQPQNGPVKMKFWSRIFLLGLVFLALARTGRSQNASDWRIFRDYNGLHQSACVSVSVTPDGKVLVRHPDGMFVTEMDGYNVKSIPLPSSAAAVSESSDGQLWVMTRDGRLEEFNQGAWTAHPAPEIGAAGDVIAPFYVAEKGHIIFLCAGQLMEYDAENPGQPQTHVLLRSDQTRLGTLTGMTVARDGGLWITGERGLGKAPRLALRPGLEKSWNVYLPPESLQIQNLQEPREDDEGGVTVIAKSSATNGQKIVAHFDGLDWAAQPAGMENILCAWQSSDRILWVATANSLYQQEPGQTNWTEYQEISDHQYNEAAMEPGGTFWVATSDGLFHYAPPLWRSPNPIQEINSPVRCLAEDAAGRLWFVAAGKLHSLQGEIHHEFALPDKMADDTSSVRALFALKDGTLLLDVGENLLQFRPDTGVFSIVPILNDFRRMRSLGLLKDGSLCVQSWNPGMAAGQFDLFDGDQFKPMADPPPESGFSTFFAVRDGDLLLGGDNGIAWYHKNKWRLFPVSDRAVPAPVICFAELPNERIWCATREKLWEFDGQTWSPISTSFNNIHALWCSRDGSVWVADDAGIHRFSKNVWIGNSREEGLPDAAVLGIFEDQRGRIWAGTPHGLSLYHPEADPDPPLTSIQLPAGDETRIREGNTITLVFGGQDKWRFTPRERLLFSWRLDERDWSVFQPSDSVSLTNLAAGGHYFQVRAMDRNGNIDPKPALLGFIVTVPWYKELRLVFIAFTGVTLALFFAVLALNRHRQLLRSYAEVEKKVAERTHELEIAGRELLQSQKMTALGTLAAGIAHDFNNILSIIKGSAQLIEENPDNPQKTRTRVDRIKTVVEQGAGIVNAMLGFSRGSGEKPGQCDLNTVVADTIRLLGDRFLREVEVKYEPAPALPEIHASKNFIQQILLNIIFNAAEAMTTRRQIIVSTQKLQRLPDNLVLAPKPVRAHVSVSVRDSGCGIPPENLPRIFDPFFTTKALSTRRGTGLGLSMVYELAKKMDAGLAVESTVGQGSTFTLILPVHDPEKTQKAE
jgi:signal transduction histidine kinase/ligand-binding sensor domain-containing protein